MARKKKEDAPLVASNFAVDAVLPITVVPAPEMPTIEVAVVEQKPEGPYDANAALYKDRSGPGNKDILSEGAANFAFHTAQARSETP